MLPYTASDTFTDSDIYDLTDLVKGGLLGESNIPVKALLDRTTFLYNRLSRFDGIKNCPDDYTFDVADLRKAFIFTIGANKTFILPDATSLPPGYLIPINTRISAIKALTVQTQSSQKIYDGIDEWEQMYMHDSDRLVLMAASDHYEIANAIGNFFNAGESFSARLQSKNTFIAQGQIVNRVDVPRLTRFLSKLTLGQQKVNDIDWLSDPGGIPVYRGCYSEGNGTSTLRIPDERGMSTRHLDLGRGIDLNRLHNFPGGYETDLVGPHKHKIYRTRTDIIGIQYEGNTLKNGGDRGLYTGNLVDGEQVTGSGTASETTIKSLGKIPLIPY